MHEYYKMATQQKEKKGPPVSVIIGGVSVALLLGGIVVYGMKQKNNVQ
jgi:hypothetical protein